MTMADKPLSGSYRNDSTLIEWEMPDYSADDLRGCARGAHKRSRRRVVNGWMGFSQTERYYCACGARLWVRYEGRLVSPDTGEEWEPGSHLRWIEDQQRMLHPGDE